MNYAVVPMPVISVMGTEAGGTEVVVNVAVRPRYLVVPKGVSDVEFTVLDVLIAGKTQFSVAGGGVPAEVFAGECTVYKMRPNGLGVVRPEEMDFPLPVNFDVCGAGQSIVVRVRNDYPCARLFKSVFYCELVE